MNEDMTEQWDRLTSLEQRLRRESAERLASDDVLIVRTVAKQAALSDERVEEGLASAEGQRELVFEIARRIREGSLKLGSLLIASNDLCKQGRYEEARRSLLGAVGAERVPLYKSLMEDELERIRQEESQG